jgi:hypothetical protein
MIKLRNSTPNRLITGNKLCASNFTENFWQHCNTHFKGGGKGRSKAYNHLLLFNILSSITLLHKVI